jgi:hypothetical protein
MKADDEEDSNGNMSMSDVTEKIHLSIPMTETYVLRGPKFTFVINENPTTPEERILDDAQK